MGERIIIIRDRTEKPPVVDHSYEADVGRYWQRIDNVLLGRKSKNGRD